MSIPIAHQNFPHNRCGPNTASYVTKLFGVKSMHFFVLFIMLTKIVIFYRFPPVFFYFCQSYDDVFKLCMNPNSWMIICVAQTYQTCLSFGCWRYEDWFTTAVPPNQVVFALTSVMISIYRLQEGVPFWQCLLQLCLFNDNATFCIQFAIRPNQETIVGVFCTYFRCFLSWYIQTTSTTTVKSCFYC